MFVLPLPGVGQAPTGASKSDTPAWMATLANHHQELIERNGDGTDASLRDSLLGLYTVDQQARTDLMKKAQLTGAGPDLTQLRPVDAKLTEELKEIVAQHGWPTIQLVGFDASNAAMTILVHTEDHVWQRNLLPTLEQLSINKKIDGSQLALLIDKELVASGKRQRHGTQFRMDPGHMTMYAVEDPAGLDERRAAAMLPPMETYKQMLASAYSMAVSDEVAPVPNEGSHP
jgi:hypothetical protein